MNSYNPTEHKNTDESPINDLPRANNCTETYPATPIVHAVRVFVQLEDDNELFNWINRKQREWNELRNKPGTNDNPHRVASEYSPSWDKQDRECEIGFFSSKTGYGETSSNGDLVRYPDHHLGLYDEAVDAKKPPLPAKCKLVLEKREEGLQTRSGNEFLWPPGPNGNRWEGTYLKIQTSYIAEPTDAVERAEEMLSAAFDEFNSLDEFGDIIPEMCRVQGVEAHIRYHRDYAKQTVRELEQSARLLGNENANATQYKEVETGGCTHFGFTTPRMDFLGFDTSGLDDPPKKVKLKTYADPRHKRRSESDPLRHWKLEAAIYGAYHWNRWEEILHHAQRIVCSHAIWAGIREDELIPDEWFLAGQQSQNPLTFKHPGDRREQLTEFWHSEEFERAVAGRLFYSQTMSYYDLLCVLLNRPNDQISYQEISDEIGLTKDSIGRIARKLEEDGIIIRCFSAVGFVRWQSQQAKETVRSLLDRDMTEADRRENIEERAAERRRNRDAQRESESESNEGDKDNTDDGSHGTVDAEELAERLLNGDIDPEEVVLQSPD